MVGGGQTRCREGVAATARTAGTTQHNTTRARGLRALRPLPVARRLLPAACCPPRATLSRASVAITLRPRHLHYNDGERVGEGKGSALGGVPCAPPIDVSADPRCYDRSIADGSGAAGRAFSKVPLSEGDRRWVRVRVRGSDRSRRAEIKQSVGSKLDRLVISILVNNLMSSKSGGVEPGSETILGVVEGLGT